MSVPWLERRSRDHQLWDRDICATRGPGTCGGFSATHSLATSVTDLPEHTASAKMAAPKLVGSGHSVARTGIPSVSALICSHKSLRAATRRTDFGRQHAAGERRHLLAQRRGHGLQDAPDHVAWSMVRRPPLENLVQAHPGGIAGQGAVGPQPQVAGAGSTRLAKTISRSKSGRPGNCPRYHSR